MMILGLLLLLGAGAVATGLIIDGRNYSDEAHLFGQTVGGMTQATFMVTGIVIGAVAAFGITMLARGAMNSRYKGKAVKREAHRLAQERDELSRRVALEAETAYALREERDALATKLEATPVTPATPAKHRAAAHR